MDLNSLVVDIDQITQRTATSPLQLMHMESSSRSLLQNCLFFLLIIIFEVMLLYHWLSTISITDHTTHASSRIYKIKKCSSIPIIQVVITWVYKYLEQTSIFLLLYSYWIIVHVSFGNPRPLSIDLLSPTSKLSLLLITLNKRSYKQWLSSGCLHLRLGGSQEAWV